MDVCRNIKVRADFPSIHPFLKGSAPGARWELFQVLAAALFQRALEPWGVVVSAVVGHLSEGLLRALELGVWESAIADSKNVVNINVSHKSFEFIEKVHAGIGRPCEVGAVKVALLGLELVVELLFVE